MSAKLKVGIVGCGLIGGKRAAAMGSSAEVTAVFDPDAARARALAAKTGAAACEALDDLLGRVDAVIVATPNGELVPASMRAVERGKHVLVEKPGARSGAELAGLEKLAGEKRVAVRVGYNHRFHPAALKARAILDEAHDDPRMFVRARYGHGGRIGYDREWRAVPELSGGGELIDQGVHLVDLSRWLLDTEFARVHAELRTFFWKMPVDDNAFLTLSNDGGVVAHLHASCTEWKNLFSFEIYTRSHKLHLEGLGGSYGVERLYHYRMRPEMGPPDTTIYEYPGADTSWTLEWAAFQAAIDGSNDRTAATLADAAAALRIVDRAYGRA